MQIEVYARSDFITWERVGTQRVCVRGRNGVDLYLELLVF